MKIISMFATADVVALVTGILWGTHVAMLATVGFVVGCILVAVCHNLVDEVKD